MSDSQHPQWVTATQRTTPHEPLRDPRVLNQQLKELEDHGMVRKVIYPVLPPKVEYFLTPEGESMLPIVDAMKAWGEQYGEAFQARLEVLTAQEAGVSGEEVSALEGSY